MILSTSLLQLRYTSIIQYILNWFFFSSIICWTCSSAAENGGSQLFPVRQAEPRSSWGTFFKTSYPWRWSWQPHTGTIHVNGEKIGCCQVWSCCVTTGEHQRSFKKQGSCWCNGWANTTKEKKRKKPKNELYCKSNQFLSSQYFNLFFNIFHYN